MVIRIATIVPVKDEAPETVRACAEALFEAEQWLRFTGSSGTEYVVLTHFIVDALHTAEAETAALRYEVATGALDITHQYYYVDTRSGPAGRTCVGMARNIGFNLAMTGAHPPDYIFTTDSDSTVDIPWYSVHLNVLQSLVAGDSPSVSHGGVILPRKSTRSATWYQYLQSNSAGNDVFEQNMAFNAQALSSAGGFVQLTHGEGRATINKVRHFGPEVRHNASVVTTSDRTIGKVPHGFAELLSRL